MPILLAGLVKSQEGRVGINTVSPKTTLDVNGKSDSNGLSLSGDITGLQAPRLTRAELTNKGNTLYGADQRGAIVYITDVSGGNNVSQRVNITSVGYYYFDGTVWNRIAFNSGALLNPVTSDNGLTKTGNSIQLGGTLIKNTEIATAGFNTIFSGAGNLGVGTNAPAEKLDIEGKVRIRSTPELAELDAKPLFIGGNGVVGTLKEGGPKTLYIDAINVFTTSNNNLLSDFNNGNHIVIRFGPINDNIRLNTMDATVNPGYVTIKQNGFYQLNASLGTSVTSSSNLNIFQVFNVEKSSDGGVTWTTVSGTRTVSLIPPNFNDFRVFCTLPTVVTQLQANDRLRMVTFRPVAANGTLLGGTLDDIIINGSTELGTKGFTFGLTKL
ncbi:hypothetical protein HIO71_03610 [Chryseobacterium aquaticum]|uniref:C1q domain-containing protein n=1 Tax=Chryseobacterium aquaticum TaxID=452084 RepID=A0A848N3Q0_9FLAO|nr:MULTISPECIES: hypothetical protein [Chryseobacterium]NMR33290.1 hypothetical protein [Chryseobacterium aquaticum]NRQ44778.1 hypothetical protein [Chryseobacterium sp. C-204]